MNRSLFLALAFALASPRPLLRCLSSLFYLGFTVFLARVSWSADPPLTVLALVAGG